MNIKTSHINNYNPEIGQPFANAEAAWFWAVAGIDARRAGAFVVPSRGGVRRPCDPDDVLIAAERLYKAGQLRRAHLIVLSEFGLRQTAPCPRHPTDAGAYRFWREAMHVLTLALRGKGIVA
ncbi:MAG: hypothetical protein FJX47_09025 [Alphaproteobacteria bacterium]|nr:hypothetical protein [Alphaproteobacteria bacterium]